MHPKLEAYLHEADGVESWWKAQATSLQSGKAVLQLSAAERTSIALQVASGLCGISGEISTALSRLPGGSLWRAEHLLKSLLDALLRSELPFGDKATADLVSCFVSAAEAGFLGRVGSPASSVLRALELIARKGSLAVAHQTILRKLLDSQAARQQTARQRKIMERVAALAGIGGGDDSLLIEAGEPWADCAIGDLSGLKGDTQEAWARLSNHAKTASGSRPSGTWLKRARQLIEPIGIRSFLDAVTRWFALVGQPGKGRPMRGYVGTVLNPTLISEQNADVLKGLAWAVGAGGDASASRVLADLAEICFKKIPVHGARCPRVGNACLAALKLLSGRDCVAELTRLRSRVKQPSVRAAVEKAIDKSAQALGVSREEVEEMSTPAYGLGSGGTVSRQLGSFSAELSIIGTCDVALRWTAATGKTVKSVPTEVKHQHAEELKDLLRIQKDVKKMLPAQVQRMERLLLEQRDWPRNVWRERYLDHPLISQLSKRLIWRLGGSLEDGAILIDGEFTRADGSTMVPSDDARVRLWHPIDSKTDTVVAWRRRLEKLRITQPFKQVHRELYVLTDAERQTHSYSNRFAAHILRQHQFAALCQARGWQYRLIGDFDSHNTPTLDLPRHGLRAEFWVEQPADDELSPAGINLRIVTDQVRFYRGTEREPVPLDQIPPLVFSEIMRDVDLFVGVASVGNDPTWQDGGPEGRYRTYWQSYSFGELSATAQTRRAVLESLLPRLSKIRDRCSLSDRFLIVRGDIRAYKIHLGSGNILMEPNDQYLCIVPSRSTASPTDVFLPFEGDATLAIILSKAFLLAQDSKIKDATITRQIGEQSAEPTP